MTSWCGRFFLVAFVTPSIALHWPSKKSHSKKSSVEGGHQEDAPLEPRDRKQGLCFLIPPSTLCEGGRPQCEETPLQTINSTGAGTSLSTVHVVYSANAKFFEPLLASMMSFARHISQPRLSVIHIIVPQQDLAKTYSMVECFRQRLSSFTAFPDVQVHEQMRPGNMSNVNPQAFARFFLHKYLPGIPRVIWLDSDTMVTGDLRPLYKRQMTSRLAAVPAQWEAHTTWKYYISREKDKKLQAQMPPKNATLFNSGVLLVDLQQWDDEVAHALENWLSLFGIHDTYGDQFVLNRQFHDSFDHLGWEWNLQGLGGAILKFPDVCIDKAKVLHWVGDFKPWKKDHGGGIGKILGHPNDQHWIPPPDECLP